jgi:hypothetical protein
MQQYYYDSMAIVRKFGRPSIFLTMTANPNWPEILQNLLPGQQPKDRPDLIARVFHLKVKELLRLIKKDGVFGPYQANVYTIEYQKRGLPHIHILIWFKSTAQFLTAERIDQVVCAELPDPSWDVTGELRREVIRTMVHGPCGDYNPSAPCMGRKTPGSRFCCQKGFPKQFAPATRFHENSYPEYRRREGDTFTVQVKGQQVTLDNRWIVPYNPYLLNQFRCHMNVEICATVQAVKYISKYVYKGSDRTTVAVAATDDEITRYLNGRYIGPTEAVWRLFEFPTHEEWPPVEHLSVHLKGQQSVYFPDDLTADQLQDKMDRTRSKLMAFFDRNKHDENARQYLYADFPSHFTWHQKTCTWETRQRDTGKIGRMYHCSPNAGERYYLRLLLTSVTGPQSYEELYSVNGVRHPTYQAACIARGLAENDHEWYHCFDEAVMFTSGRGLRTLFLTGLRQAMITDPGEI